MPCKPAVFRPAYLEARNAVVRGGQRRYSRRLRRQMENHKRDHPLCVGCKAVGRITAATVCDHVIPAADDSALLWSSSNLQSCCAFHHNVVKQRLEIAFRAGKATTADLNLDSRAAIALTKQFDTGGEGSCLFWVE